jgi:hypothetical protein
LTYGANTNFASRELTLDFTVEGADETDFLSKKTAFLTLMYGGEVSIRVPTLGDEVYHLVYRGKGGEYGINYNRTFCHMILKFTEPNPYNR